MSAALDLRLGIDVGGTNTDAVVLDRAGALLAKAKRPTTRRRHRRHHRRARRRPRARPASSRAGSTHVMLGTTHATNAVLERRGLERVAVVRIGAPVDHRRSRRSTTGPTTCATAVSAGEAIVGGGIEFDGREIVAARTATSCAGSSSRSPARSRRSRVTSVFASGLRRARAGRRGDRPRGAGRRRPVSLSHEIGSIGLLERENATVLNAALRAVAARGGGGARGGARGARAASRRSFFAQNDGTLMALDYAVRHPVLTIGSGPANSIRGAAYLTGAADALVADVGGTSTDVGVLVNGFPRESSAAGRDRRRPHELPHARPGRDRRSAAAASSRRRDGAARRARAASATGCRERGAGVRRRHADPDRRRGRLPAGPSSATARRPTARRARLLAGARARRRDAGRRRRPGEDRPRRPRRWSWSAAAASLVPDRAARGQRGASGPPHHDVANAIGAAIAAVSGQVDRIYHVGESGRDALLAQARDEARGRGRPCGCRPGQRGDRRARGASPRLPDHPVGADAGESGRTAAQLTYGV